MVFRSFVAKYIPARQKQGLRTRSRRSSRALLGVESLEDRAVPAAAPMNYGGLDPTFGIDGAVRTSIEKLPHAMAFDAAGNIVIAGEGPFSGGRPFLARF